MKTLQDLWREYRDKVYPDGVSADQNRECHQAFFAGAFVMFSEMSQASELSEDAALRRTGALYDEAKQTLEARGMNLKARN